MRTARFCRPLFCAQNAVKVFRAVERDPRELSAVIVQKSGRETHTASGGDVGERRVVIGAVEIGDFFRCRLAVSVPRAGRQGSRRRP